MPAFLVPVDSGEVLIALEKAIVLVGRQSDCDVSLTHSRKISRKHCCIAQVNNKFVVRDLGSTNGVFLNGNRIERDATITFGDELIIGDVRFVMQNEAPPVAGSGVAKKSVEKKSSANAETQGPASKKSPSVVPPPIPRRKPPIDPPSMDLPIALPDSDEEFSVEDTAFKNLKKNTKKSRSKRVDDVLPLGEDDVLKLASDSRG